MYHFIRMSFGSFVMQTQTRLQRNVGVLFREEEEEEAIERFFLSERSSGV